MILRRAEPTQQAALQRQQAGCRAAASPKPQADVGSWEGKGSSLGNYWNRGQPGFMIRRSGDLRGLQSTPTT